MLKIRATYIQPKLLHKTPWEKHASSLLASLLTKELCLKAYLIGHCTPCPLVMVTVLSVCTLVFSMVNGSAPYRLLQRCAFDQWEVTIVFSLLLQVSCGWGSGFRWERGSKEKKIAGIRSRIGELEQKQNNEEIEAKKHGIKDALTFRKSPFHFL